MRASRLVAILLLLQTRERMTAQELATRLEVSKCTIYRDVQSLATAGVPVYGEAGHEGGYRLVDASAMRADAQLKLLAALPAELRERTERLRERFHLDAPSWYQDTRIRRRLGREVTAVDDE